MSNATDMQVRVEQLENKWLVADPDGEMVGVDAQTLQDLSIQALTGLAQLSNNSTSSPEKTDPEAFADWLAGIAERYYMTDHEVNAIIVGRTIGAAGGNSAWFGEFEALWRWWKEASKNQSDESLVIGMTV